MTRARLLPATLLIAVAAATAAACGTTDSNSSSGASARTTPGATVTTTVVTQNPPPPSTSPPSSSATAPAADASTVVNDYFAAINAQDYARAWALGGKNFNSSYSSFVNGFAGTSADVVTILVSGPSSVTLHLDAVQTDGTVKSFEGTYTVSGGEITKASVHEVAGSQPSAGAPGATPYDNCTDAHNDGATSIPSTDPRYAKHLDRDNDGLACEPNESGPPPTSSSTSP